MFYSVRELPLKVWSSFGDCCGVGGCRVHLSLLLLWSRVLRHSHYPQHLSLSLWAAGSQITLKPQTSSQWLGVEEGERLWWEHMPMRYVNQTGALSATRDSAVSTHHYDTCPESVFPYLTGSPDGEKMTGKGGASKILEWLQLNQWDKSVIQTLSHAEQNCTRWDFFKPSSAIH